MQDPVTQRFIKEYERLKKEGAVQSQKEFADALGFPEQYFSGYRGGGRKVSTKIVNKLATIYRVSLNYLLNGEEDAQPEQASYRIKGNANVQGTGNQVTGARESDTGLQQALVRIEELEKLLQERKDEIEFLRGLLMKK